MTRILIADGDADTAQVAAFERDRRQLIRLGLGLGLGGAVVAASAIPLLLAVRNAFADDDADGALLVRGITLERVSALAYDTILRNDVLSDRLARQLRVLRGHELQHAAALTKALTDFGASAPPPPAGVEDVDKVVKGLEDVRSQADALSFAIELETAVVAAYHDAQAKFVANKLLQTAGSIMGCEGQHLVVLREAARQPPVPNALETGEQ